MVDSFITRALMPADLEVRTDDEGRTVHGVIVPFDRETVINQRGEKYREVFRHGAFTRSINAGVNRVKLFVNHNHLRGKEPVGVATSLTEERKQLVGSFRVADTPAGHEAIQMVHDGVYDAFSVGFSEIPGQTVRNKDLVERREVKLFEVSLVAYPAYADAAIAGIRGMFPEFTDEVLERMLQLANVDVLDHLLELAKSDTRQSEPAEGTSDDSDSSSGDDSADDGHSSTRSDDSEPHSPPQPPIQESLPTYDSSAVGRQRARRQAEMFHANVGKY